MADNTTFIRPQWYLPREPDMSCEPHSKIAGMLATYNIVSVIISLTLSSSFFFRQTQWLLGRAKIVYTKLKQLFGFKSASESPVSYWEFPLPSFAMSVTGSILISLSAPLLAGMSITSNHPSANRWVLIEQWATRPRATFFIWISNLAAVFKKRGFQGDKNPDQENDGFLTTAISAVAAELVVSLFPIRFLINQDNTPRSTFDQSLPCTSYGPNYYGPVRRTDDNNCPDMQTGNYGLILITILNSAIGVVSLGIFIALKGDMKPFRWFSQCCLVISLGYYAASWQLWRAFLHNVPEDMYCVESSMAINIIYCLLPVFFGCLENGLGGCL